VKAVQLHGPKAAGRVALVDDDDYDLISGYRWRAWEAHRASGIIDGPYARASLKRNGHRVLLYMHKLITGWPMTDHANGNGLDNQRSNLRPATRAQNSHNQRSQGGSSSRHKGVTWHRQVRKWQAAIKVDGKHRYLGCYESEEDAARAYEAAALEAWGEYAYAARAWRGDGGHKVTCGGVS
jgi:hypothetical protein